LLVLLRGHLVEAFTLHPVYGAVRRRRLRVQFAAWAVHLDRLPHGVGALRGRAGDCTPRAIRKYGILNILLVVVALDERQENGVLAEDHV
jgi:hypothetical protein